MENRIEKILQQCKERRKLGKDKYGDDAYVYKNMFEEIRQEHYDIINYHLFQLLKLDVLEKKSLDLIDLIHFKEWLDDEKRSFDSETHERG